MSAVSVSFIALVTVKLCNMPKIEPASCQRAPLQFSLVTGPCVRDCSVREWDVAVAMLTPGKKSALPMQLKKSDLHILSMEMLPFIELLALCLSRFFFFLSPNACVSLALV